MLMDGNGKDGKTLKDDGVRMLTSKMFDARAGGTVQFQLRSFGTKGEGTCYTDYTKMKKEEQDKKRAIEQEQKKKAEQAAKKAAEQTAKAKKAEAEKKKKDEEKNKLEAKRMEEVKARKQCLSSPPCNGHGRGVYKSKCNEKTWECTSRQCTCNCIGNWYGQRCDKYMGTSQCQSVGDPHPLSLDGLRFNIYDAGEFLMFKHPEHPVEIHELTRMARPHIAATAGVAMRTEGTTISIEQPHCGNRNNFQARLSMSCHGDRTDSSHVFKAVMGKLETAPRGAEPTATGASAATGTGAEAATGPRQVVHVALPCDKPNGCPKEDEKKPEPYQRMNDKITMVKASEAATGASTGAATGASF